MGSCLGSCVSKETPESNTSSSSSVSYTSCWLRQATDEQDAELISNTSERCRRHGLIYRILRFKTKKNYSHFIDKFLERQHSNADYAKLANTHGQFEASQAHDIQLQNLDVYKLLNASALAKESELNQCARATASSRASSSLDLEWEHEYGQLRQYQLQQQQRESVDLLQHEIITTNHHQQTHQAYHSSCDQLASNVEQNTLPSNMPQSTSTNMQHATTSRAAAASTRFRHAGNVTRHGSFTRTSCGSSQNSWSHISTPESLEWDIDEEQEQQRRLRCEDDNLDDETLKLLHQIEQLKYQVLQETGEGLYGSESLEFNVHHFGASGHADDSGNVVGGQMEAHIS